jgi:hypothetical protein
MRAPPPAHPAGADGLASASDAGSAARGGPLGRSGPPARPDDDFPLDDFHLAIAGLSICRLVARLLGTCSLLSARLPVAGLAVAGGIIAFAGLPVAGWAAVAGGLSGLVRGRTLSLLGKLLAPRISLVAETFARGRLALIAEPLRYTGLTVGNIAPVSSASLLARRWLCRRDGRRHRLSRWR